MKAVDIRTAFMAGSMRKRKRRISGAETDKIEEKSLKLNVGNTSSENIPCDVIPIVILSEDSKSEIQINSELENEKPAANEVLTESEALSNGDLSKDSPKHNADDALNCKGGGTHIPDLHLSSDNSVTEEEVQSLTPNTSSLNVSMASDMEDKPAVPGSSSSQHSSSASEPPSENDAEALSNQNSGSGLSQSNSTMKPIRKRKKMSLLQAKLKEEKRAQKMKEKMLKVAAKLAEKEKLKEKKEEERKRKREEKELEKKEKERLRQEKKEQEEQRKLQEKEERNRLKQQLLESKAEERKKKEEEKRRAEEEKKRVEEAKKKIQMEKERKTKEAFHNFFVKSGFSISPTQAPEKALVFRPFQVSEDMVLADIVPPAAQARFNRQELENCLQMQNSTVLYLKLLKSEKYKSIRYQKNEAKTKSEDEVIVLNGTKDTRLHLRAKLLQFCENIRPAYFGTWRKKSVNVCGRRPFGKDSVLDYDVDSDEEWDEGGPGESLTGTEDEESEDDYEVDNEFFVPHGYLSAEEEGDEDSAPADPEELKMRLKMKEHEFLSERKKKTTELKPVILGCFFESDLTSDLSTAEKFLKPYSAEPLTSIEIPSLSTSRLTDSASFENTEKSSPSNEGTSKSITGVIRPVPEEAMPFLIKLLHANTNSRNFVVREFQEFWRNHCRKIKNCATSNELKDSKVPVLDNEQLLESETSVIPKVNRNYKISKRQLAITIQNISTWGKCPNGVMKGRCWWVKDDVLQKYDSTDIPVPNQWNYTSSINNLVQPET